MIRSMHKIEMDMVVIQEVFRHQAYIGSSTTVEDYPGRLSILLNYIPAVWTLQLKILSKPFSRKRISKECKYDGDGIVAWFDFTPESLEWHKRVAKELWICMGIMSLFMLSMYPKKVVGPK